MSKSDIASKALPLLKRHLPARNLLYGFVASRYLRAMAQTHLQERGTRMACFANEEIGIELYVNGLYERYHIEALHALIDHLGLETNNLAFCDVGANIGNHSIHLSRFFGKTFAYEPNPDVYHLLKYNLSNIASAEAFNIGLGESTAELDLYQNETNLGASSAIYKSNNAIITKVPIRKFDDVYPEDIPLGLMKIDVEGMEYQVLKGAMKIIEKYRPLIAFEQHLEHVTNYQHSAIAVLEEIGYTVCWLDFSSGRHRSPITKALTRVWEIICGRTTEVTLVARAEIPKTSHTMLIAVPSEEMESITA